MKRSRLSLQLKEKSAVKISEEHSFLYPFKTYPIQNTEVWTIDS